MCHKELFFHPTLVEELRHVFAGGKPRHYLPEDLEVFQPEPEKENNWILSMEKLALKNKEHPQEEPDDIRYM